MIACGSDLDDSLRDVLEQLLASVEEDKYLIEDWDVQGQVCAAVCEPRLTRAFAVTVMSLRRFIYLGKVV